MRKQLIIWYLCRKCIKIVDRHVPILFNKDVRAFNKRKWHKDLLIFYRHKHCPKLVLVFKMSNQYCAEEAYIIDADTDITVYKVLT